MASSVVVVIIVIVVVVVVGVCNRCQMRTSKCTCLIFGVSIGLDISPTISGWLLVLPSTAYKALSKGEFKAPDC